MARRKWEREQVRRDAADDMSEDMSEGEKERGELIGEHAPGETPSKKFQRNISNLEVWNDDNKDKKLYIVLIRYLFPKVYMIFAKDKSLFYETLSISFLFSLLDRSVFTALVSSYFNCFSWQVTLHNISVRM